MSLIKLQSVFAGRKTVIHLSLRTENEYARLFIILYSSSEFVAAPIFRHVPVAWLAPEVSFPTQYYHIILHYITQLISMGKYMKIQVI